MTTPEPGTGRGSTTLALIASTADERIAGRRGELFDLLFVAGADIDAGEGVALESAIYYVGASNSVPLLLSHAPTLDLRLAAGVGDLAQVRTCFDGDGRLLPGTARLGSPPSADAAGRAALLDKALAYACMGAKKDRLPLARYLVDRGARATSVVYGATALHFACTVDEPDLVRLLLTAGADPTVRDHFHDSTPAAWAQYFKHVACADVLREFAARPPVDQPGADGF